MNSTPESQPEKILAPVWLRRIRKDLDLTQQKFGERIKSVFKHIADPIGLYISKLETGAIKMTPDHIRGVANTLGIALTEPLEDRFFFPPPQGRGEGFGVWMKRSYLASVQSECSASNPSVIDHSIDLRHHLKIIGESNFPITWTMIYPI